MLPVALVAEVMPYAPGSLALRVLHIAAALIGAVIGGLWIARPWPTARVAVQFLVASDVLLAIGFAVLRSPEARLSASVLFAMPGMYAAFLLGWRILILHCAFALVAIVSMTWYGTAVDGRPLFDLFAFAAPSLIVVIALPVTVQAVVEVLRFAVTSVATEWSTDSLTGALNRRGLHEETRRLTESECPPGAVHLWAAVDLDGFKAYNDTHGHLAGDVLLTSVAERLKKGLPGAVVARVGGDEFAVFAVLPSSGDARRMVESLREIVLPRGSAADGRIPASVGVVLCGAQGGRGGIQDVLASADAVLYEAKRSAGSSVVVRDLVGPSASER